MDVKQAENKVDYEKISELVTKLKSHNQTISMMESCTGGGLANSITNIAGASEVFEFGAVTYSNKAKITIGGEKMKDTIDNYSVYSKEVAEVMAETITKFAGSTYGIGVTGELGVSDATDVSRHNNANQVYFSIYDSIKRNYETVHLVLDQLERGENKAAIINEIVDKIVVA